MDFTASSIYGGTPSPQQTPNATPSHAPGPEPMARTLPLPGKLGASWSNPTFLLVVLAGVAFALIHFSLDFDAPRLDFKVSA